MYVLHFLVIHCVYDGMHIFIQGSIGPTPKIYIDVEKAALLTPLITAFCRYSKYEPLKLLDYWRGKKVGVLMAFTDVITHGILNCMYEHAYHFTKLGGKNESIDLKAAEQNCWL